MLVLDQPRALIQMPCIAQGPVTVNAFSGDHAVTIVRQPVQPANCTLTKLATEIPSERIAP